MSPYRLPPAQPRPAPAAPWWRVAWAVVSRSLLQRLRDREARTFARSLKPWVTEATEWRIVGHARVKGPTPEQNIGNTVRRRRQTSWVEFGGW